jgi:succinyl-CoA synthetase alpha subunit
MIVKGISKKGAYYDSVTLMIVSKEINKIDGILDSTVVMGTMENKAIMQSAGLWTPEFNALSDTDLLICVKADNSEVADNAIKSVDGILKELRSKKDEGVNSKTAHSFEQAISQLPNANLSLISVAGKYAAREAKKALDNGLHVMLFSDNVSIADELELKKLAKEKGLLVMGSDCGTAIINGVPLAFANVVNQGNIGIVAASGTGLQEISCIISNMGAGISQAIGTGGRDVKQEIGGIMFIESLKALASDSKTECIVLVSKPPHPDVLKKISEEIKSISKPVVGIFIGGNPEILSNVGAIPASTLEEAAIIAVAKAQGKDVQAALQQINSRKLEIDNKAKELSKIAKGKYLRGLFSGGTLCDEAQLVMKDMIGNVYSNSPLSPDFKLKDLWVSNENTILDMGEDEFTSGRPHPMIDFSLRKKRIESEAADPNVAVILLDVVLGYGSHMDPASELVPSIQKAKEISPKLIIICSVTGTIGDPQKRELVIEKLKNAGVEVLPSNAAAAQLAGRIVSIINH